MSSQNVKSTRTAPSGSVSSSSSTESKTSTTSTASSTTEFKHEKKASFPPAGFERCVVCGHICPLDLINRGKCSDPSCVSNPDSIYFSG